MGELFLDGQNGEDNIITEEINDNEIESEEENDNIADFINFDAEFSPEPETEEDPVKKRQKRNR